MGKESHYESGRIDDQGRKQGTFLEGERSHSHTHRDGTKGTDVQAFRNTYRDGEIAKREVAKDWGKVHEHDSGSGK